MSFMNKIFTSVMVIILAIVGFVYSGIFNVSAQWEDPALVRWLLVSTREASIEARADSITSPTLGGATQLENGFRSYREMCAVCHTPPGSTDSPINQGLNPTPPDLTKVNDHAMSNEELFWVIKNGIRMTGMPAWGPTHDDVEIWDIVAFLKELPNIDAAEYKRLGTQVASGHAHGAASEKEVHMEDRPANNIEGHADNNTHHNSDTKKSPADNHDKIIEQGTHGH